ncbi:MAG TPA: transcriptional repressor NrdR [Kiritimatiellae bacterium]|nr:transcriptional repressor NrdR [Kiritimatiellia bacterium]
MRCPKCAESRDRVVDSRSVREGTAIRRRRICLSCGHRFTTYEEVVRASLRVIKRDGRHEELSREKLVRGIQRACEKRPVSMEDIERLVDAVISELESEYEREVPSTVIGKKVMERLEDLDEVAYVRFASVYRRFRDVSQFLSEVEELIGRE